MHLIADGFLLKELKFWGEITCKDVSLHSIELRRGVRIPLELVSLLLRIANRPW